MSEWKALSLFKVLFALSAFQHSSCAGYVGDGCLDENCRGPSVCVTSVNDSSLNKCYTYKGANFGLEIKPDEYLEGVVVLASPSNACSVVVPKKNQSISGSRDVFLLIDEGGCAFDLKAYLATQAGYSAAIIRNMETDDIIIMEGDKYESQVKIPAIYVGNTAGNSLERNDYLNNPAARVEISSGPTAPPLWELEFYMIPFAIIVGICFVLMAMFMISRYYRHYLEQRRSRLSPTSLRKIPTKKYKKGDDFYDLCAICLEEYKDGERLRILPCEHAYHCKCVDPWLTEGKRTCPVCKQPVENNRRTRGRRERENLEAGESTNDADETTPLISSQSTQSSHSVLA